jgi:DNA (cytosine-5)-methyltransferase 1
MLNVLDLFSGIGGFSLGLERTNGFKTIAFCEIDPFCRKVLAKHWPGVPCFEDITKLGEGELNGLGKVDVICGGFPCQDISCAGKGAGIHAERSGLWWEMLRIVRLVRPRYVLVENVAALLNRGLDEVLGSLAESGYDAEWQVLRASEFGLPHKRERIWILANSGSMFGTFLQGEKADFIQRKIISDNHNNGQRWRRIIGGHSPKCVGWEVEPAICGIDDGISSGLGQLRALGNAIVPQCAQYVGECILAAPEEA